MKAKLGDLGSARFKDASLSVGLVSPQYIASERLDGRSTCKTDKSDVYSMGVSLCELFTGDPASRDLRQRQIRSIQHQSLRALCVQMVSEDTESRPSAGQALAVIDHVCAMAEYRMCPAKRLVKGLVDGEDEVTLTDRPW